ncbi:MAG: hypothetical protein NZ520_02575 [bacterium]|nr:hypothetical protein [bacterium]
MIDLSQIVEELSTVLGKPAAEKVGRVILSVYESAVLQRIDAIESTLKWFAEEMRRSQEHLAQRVEEQIAAHRRETDERFRELREAQQQMYAEFQEYRKLTDERLRELREEFQEYRRLTDERFRELAETVRLTQEALRELALTVKDLQKQVGGLSQSFGYVLENEAIKKLPKLLLRDYGVRVVGRLKRGYVQDGAGRHIEVNLFGSGQRNGEQVTIVGESKSQLSKRDVDRFLQRTVESLREVYPNILPVLVTHMTSEPDAEEYARRLGVAVYYSYEF